MFSSRLPFRPLYGLLLFGLLLAACQPAAPSAAPPSAAPPTAATAPSEAASAPPPASEGTERSLQAVEIQAEVWLEETSETRRPILEGDRLPLQGVVETGPDSRARLDILPEGTIIRVGAETRLQLTALAPQEPASRFALWFGRMWVILNGGQLEVETGSGLASVRGSMLGLRFNPESGELRVTCLEGHCALGNEQGQVELVAGQAATIPAAGEPPSPPEDILPEEQQEWLEQAPEAAPLLPHLSPSPPPTGGSVPPFIMTAYNGCQDTSPPPLGVGPWTLTFTAQDGAQYTYTLAPQENLEITLPGGSYQVEALFPDGSTDVTTLASEQTPLYVDLCTPPPENSGAGGHGGGNPPPTPGLSLTPTTYTLTNTCDETWHWIFTGPTTIQVDVAPGQTVSGTLQPSGTYTAEDWLDGAPSHNYTTDIPPGGNLTVTTGCP